jgi:hypothetical protein
MRPELIQSGKRKPHGFDPGLQALAGVLIWTLATKLFLRTAIRSHNPFLVFGAMTSDVGGMAIFFVFSLVIWVRHKRTASAPRTWAVLIAIIWSAASLATWLLIMLRTSGHAPTVTNIDRETFSVSIPAGWIENTNLFSYDPNSYVLLKGPNSTLFSILIRRQSLGNSVDDLIAKQRDAFSKKFSEATIMGISNWAGHDGRGLQIDGKILETLGHTSALIPHRVTIFSFANGDRICLIVENATPDDYQTYDASFKMLRRTFTLK